MHRYLSALASRLIAAGACSRSNSNARPIRAEHGSVARGAAEGRRRQHLAVGARNASTSSAGNDAAPVTRTSTVTSRVDATHRATTPQSSGERLELRREQQWFVDSRVAAAARSEKHTKRDAAIGAGAGAVIGAITSKNKVKGGIIGGAVGGILGGVIGNNVDKKKKPVTNAVMPEGERPGSPWTSGFPSAHRDVRRYALATPVLP